MTKDLKDHQGTVFYQKGQRVNPLETRALTKPLLFIDGDESLHLTWAFLMLKRHPLAKVILVKGASLQIMRELGIQVFFDQAGKITQKLGIRQVPAIVTQEGGMYSYAKFTVSVVLNPFRWSRLASGRPWDGGLGCRLGCGNRWMGTRRDQPEWMGLNHGMHLVLSCYLSMHLTSICSPLGFHANKP